MTLAAFTIAFSILVALMATGVFVHHAKRILKALALVRNYLTADPERSKAFRYFDVLLEIEAILRGVKQR